MGEIVSADESLKRWLDQWGMTANPFQSETRNAEKDPNLSCYFLDQDRQFDELLHATTPCVVYAGRGCGKTALRQMLAVNCRPLDADSHRLGIAYSYSAFEQLGRLGQMGSLSQLARPYVAVLLRQALTALQDQVAHDRRVQECLTEPAIASEYELYLASFASDVPLDSSSPKSPTLEQATSLELLEGLARLIHAAGFSACVVLLDGLDEMLSTSGDPTEMARLIAPLLANLPLLECRGMAFRFFLPHEIEPTLRKFPWYRPDRLKILRIRWTEHALQELIGQRLTFYGPGGGRLYSRLGQFCQPQLAETIDQELAKEARSQPRAAVILAEMLFRAHCETPHPPLMIAEATWHQVKQEWQSVSQDYTGTWQTAPVTASTPKPTEIPPESPIFPLLQVDLEHGRVRVGARDITHDITAQDFRVLRCLWLNRDKVCERYDIFTQAWPDEKMDKVGDAALNASIKRLRDNLGQTDPDNGYIETIKGRGYGLHPGGFSWKPLS